MWSAYSVVEIVCAAGAGFAVGVVAGVTGASITGIS
jgi:hypothetical protein